ncbi:MAG TPA: response regulator [Chitinophagaceae bacterium]|nr:response regulator [Chitinophagaceae bacterium]
MPRTQPENSAPKILIVDDDADLVALVTTIFKRHGFEVCSHNSGVAVAEVVSYHLPHLILLDIGLPAKSGTEVCKELKKRHSIPIIFFSAHEDRNTAYKECAADGFIQKPFNIKDLVRVVSSYVN